MNIQFAFKGMAKWEQDRVLEYAMSKTPALEKLLQHMDIDEVKLLVRAERFEKNNAYSVELVLEMRSSVFVGTEASHSIDRAIDLAKDRLVKQMKKHEDVLKSKGKARAGKKQSEDEVASRSHRSIKVSSDRKATHAKRKTLLRA